MENMIRVGIPSIYNDLYKEVKNIPFYKVENGYQYAAYLLKNEETAPAASSFLCEKVQEEQEEVEQIQDGDEQEEEFKKVFKEAIKELSEIVISDDAFTFWTTFKKERDGIETYHKILDKLYEQILLVGFRTYIKIREDKDQNEDEGTGTIHLHEYHTQWNSEMEMPCRNEAKIWKEEMDLLRYNRSMRDSNMVLNHNNPFADISIQEQKFIYGSILNQFESLSLTTSHTIMKQDKDTEKSYMVLQPGFKIKKDRDISETSKQDVIFDNTLTSEITNTDKNIYVYID